MTAEPNAPETTVAEESMAIWLQARDELSDLVAIAGYQTWLANATLIEAVGERFVIGVASQFASDWVRERYLKVIQDTLSAIVGRDCDVEITVDPSMGAKQSTIHEPVAGDGTTSPVEKPQGELPSVTFNERAPHAERLDSRLNPSFTFSSFVVGNSSKLAHAACYAVAEKPGKAYNPLFLYGGVGLGKTHLMHAIGHAVADRGGRPVIAYVSSEKFMNEMIAGIAENKMHEFRTRYRSVDVLLIDDIQFLAGKDRTQEEFFHTFNALYEIDCQIVVSSDRPPNDIPTIEDRLRSRFSGGLTVDIQPPDFETRLAILQSKLGGHSALVPDEVCMYIAHKIQRNIRELEGALVRVVAHASLTHEPVSLVAATEILKDIIPADAARPLTARDIQQVCATYYGVSIDDLTSIKRDRRIVFPRQVAMFLMREMTPSSLPAIGAAFIRDHTTVLHACEKVSDLEKDDPRVASDLNQLREALSHV